METPLDASVEAAGRDVASLDGVDTFQVVIIFMHSLCSLLLLLPPVKIDLPPYTAFRYYILDRSPQLSTSTLNERVSE